MLAMMLRHAAPLLFLSLLTPAFAQRSLNDLQRQFAEEARKLATSEPSPEQRTQLLRKHTEELARFVAGEAKGDDRRNGHLMLADLKLTGGDDKGAIAALRGIDTAAAPALLLATAATMAQHLAVKELRDALVKAAIAKPSPTGERLATARLLMTVLLEVEAGEAMFTAALQAAPDDEQRAFVRWHRADALRDREDLPDNTGFEELEKLAKDLPATYWGGVAKDVLRATNLKVGDDAISFRAPAIGGGEVDTATLRGKAVVLAFWSQSDQDTPALLGMLQQVRQQHGAKVAVVGICLDRDPAAIAAAVKALHIDFPEVGDGKGDQNDVALRWFVHGPTLHVLDKNGKVAGLGLQAGTADGRKELAEVVGRAVSG